jgi:protease YdgD
MLRVRSRVLLRFAAAGILMLAAANSARSGTAIGPLELHREAVDELRYPWSSIGKLFNETGASCSGVVIARDKILTAAHCLFNARTRRFIPAEALHFLVGYRTGRYSAHARIASYEIGAGFDPLRYDQTSEADWAVLTVTENLPAEIEPLRLRRELAPSGTKAVLVGYPQDRAFAMSADRDCELRDKISAGRLLLHTCRSTYGYSGGPILVSTGGREMEVAGIQIASMQSNGTEKMIAVPAQAIGRQDREIVIEPPPAVEASAGEIAAACDATANGEDMASEGMASLATIRARLDFEQPDVVSSITGQPADAARAMAWLASEPFAIAIP